MMQITVTGRHMELTPALRDYATAKVNKLTKYIDNILEAHIVLSVEKYRHLAEITIHLDGVNINSKDETEDMYASIDQVVEKIERQLLKRKSKYTTQSNRKENTTQTLRRKTTKSKNTESPETKSEIGQLVESQRFASKPMAPEEAMLQLKISSDQFLVFTNAATNTVNVVYKKKDGNIGLVEPDIS